MKKMNQLKKERLESYERKLMMLSERREDVERWCRGDIEEIKGNKLKRLAIYKAFQEAMEAAMDLCAMILKDIKVMVSDDYENVVNLKERGVISDKIKDILQEGNGLRNRLIHEYNKLDAGIALESARRISKGLEDFEREIKKWLKS